MRKKFDMTIIQGDWILPRKTIKNHWSSPLLARFGSVLRGFTSWLVERCPVGQIRDMPGFSFRDFHPSIGGLALGLLATPSWELGEGFPTTSSAAMASPSLCFRAKEYMRSPSGSDCLLVRRFFFLLGANTPVSIKNDQRRLCA